MRIDSAAAAALLKEQQDILIICHESPDGDTTGSAFALAHALGRLGKRVRIACSDPLPRNCSFFTETFFQEEFLEKYVVAVDVADSKLFGDKLEAYKTCTDLCIDHHPTNTQYAKKLLLRPQAAATAEIIFEVIQKLGITVDKEIAQCLYTGLATDTGCFLYSNTTADTHRLAAQLMETGIDFAAINRLMFETKTPGRVAMEKLLYNDLKYYFDGRCAVICITRDMLEQTGASGEELEGLASLPRQIEGVEVGVTMKQREDRASFKVSVRTNTQADASKICGLLGGGGHAKAAGCLVMGGIEEARMKILDAVKACL